MTRPRLAGAATLMLALTAPAFAQMTQQQLDQRGTHIEVHQSHKSDATGAQSSMGTQIQRADSSGKAISGTKSIRVEPLPPPVESSITTTTTTIGRQ
jgi:hypothetical protein